MIFTSSTLYMDPKVDCFTVSYKVDLYMAGLIGNHLFQPYGLAERDKDIDIGVSIMIEAKTEKLVVIGPKLINNKTTIDYEAFFPYYKIKKAADERTEYINTFFETLTIILPQHGVPVEAIEKVKTMVFAELTAHPEKYIYTPIERPDMDEILKKHGYNNKT